MTKRRSAKAAESRAKWRENVANPLLQQILALLIVALGIITLLALFGVTTGVWADGIVKSLRYVLGWGAYPFALGICLAGLLWLQHHLDRPVEWRWRPFVGAELVFFSLLTLTHVAVARANFERAWELVGSSLGGGVVGWAVSVLMSQYLGLPASMLILVCILLLGLGLAFDFTFEDVKGFVSAKETKRRPGAVRVNREASSQRRRQSRTDSRSTPAREAMPPQAIPLTPMRQPTASQMVASASVSPPSAGRASKPPVLDNQSGDTGWSRPAGLGRTRPTEAPAEVFQAVEEPYVPQEYHLPPMDLLREASDPPLTDAEVRDKSRIIENTLAQFGLPVEVAEVRVGPAITQFGLKPGYLERSNASGRKVRVHQISALADDLALALAAPRLRVEAPVPGRAIVGIEVPNNEIQIVGVREVMESEEFERLSAPLAFAVGRDVAGAPVVADLAKMPHLLIAGTTGSGKSICIKAITACLICTNTPDDLRLVMIDPKMVELVRFNGLPHLYGRVEVDLERVVKVLRWVAHEMDTRYKRFAAAAARNLDDYNELMDERGERRLPRIVVLVDELADLMMMAPDEVEKTICRIAQMARATGIHLILATQRPSVDVVTGLIKANFPARISFATVSQTDSRVILDMQGAETLLGRGDMLYMASDAGHPVRVQGCFVSEDELEDLVQFWRDEVGPIVSEAPWERMISSLEQDEAEDEGDGQDDMLQEAIALVQQTGEASASLLQRRLRIGHPRAARLIETMEEQGIIGPQEAAGRTRRVIIGSDK
ncbi:MAG: DNA translocase FtsK [Chloroflexi bacterium]|nr:DNA translocase FtsK [Chloroflexota bacterium]